MQMSGQDKLSYKSFGLVMTLVAFALALITVFLPTHRVFSASPGHLLTYSTFDSAQQLLAHKVMLCALAVLGVLSPWLRTALSRVLGPRAAAAVNRGVSGLRQAPLLAMALLLPLFLWLYRSVGRDQYLLGLFLFAAIFLCGAKPAQNRLVRLGCGLALVLYALLLLLPGFLGTYVFGGLESAIMHYYALFGLSPSLAKGGEILANMRFYYGLLPQALLAIPQRSSELLQMGDYILLVQIFQVVFTLLGLACYRLCAPGAVLRALLCMSLWLPWISTAGESIMGPTSSGFRFMNYPLAVFTLLCAARLPRNVRPLVLGATAGFALLHNLETGICVSLAFIAYSVVSGRIGDVAATSKRLLLLLLGMLASAGIFSLVFRLGLGRWPLVSVSALFSFFNHFSSGFGGSRLHFDPMATLVLLFTAFLLARLTCVWLRAGLSEKMRFKFAISFLILLWMAYYFNRVHPWNLWTHTFLFTFLIIDLLPAPKTIRADGIGLTALGRRKVPFMAVVLIFILGPTAMNNGLSVSKYVWRSTAQRLALAKDSTGMERISGIWIEAPCAEGIKAQTAYVAQAAKGKRVLFVSANQFLLQMQTGLVFPLPYQDLFVESFTPPDLTNNVAALKAAAPDQILIDEPGECLYYFPGREAFRDVLAGMLAPDYRLTQHQGGWRVFERAAAPAAQ